MESVRSAQIQVDMWIQGADIYTDQPFWQHCRTGQITFDQPTIQFFLPPNFKIPEQPPDLPEGIDIDAQTSSSEESLGEWQRKCGEKRRFFFKSPSRSQRSHLQTMEADYHDNIINPDVLSLREDQQLEYIADDNSSVSSQQLSLGGTGGQQRSFRRTVRMPTSTQALLPRIASSSRQQQQQQQQLSADQQRDFFSSRSQQLIVRQNSQSKSKNILAMIQLNSPLDATGLDSLQETLRMVSFPNIDLSPRPDNLHDVAVHLKPKINDEFETAYKAVRKVRKISLVSFVLYPFFYLFYLRNGTK
jgi:hypothetical protein